MTHAGGADFSLVFDADAGDAYIAYGSWHNYAVSEGWRAEWYPDWAKDGHQIAIEKLDPSTFVEPAVDSGAVTVTSAPQEAPAFFKRGGFFYLVHGDLCCFCARGGDAKVLASRSAQGPYALVGQLNAWGEDHVPAQNSDVFEVRAEGARETTYVWAADLWFSSKSGMKVSRQRRERALWTCSANPSLSQGDDHQYWEPLVWEDQEVEGLGTVPVPRRAGGGKWMGEWELGQHPSETQSNPDPNPNPNPNTNSEL
jgi:hypothetical protein